MKTLIRYSELATFDIDDVVAVIAKDSIAAAVRFAPAVFKTLDGLAEFPGKGSLKQYTDPKLAGIRSYAIEGFPNHLIFYRREADGALLVLLISEGSRDFAPLLRRRV